MTNVILPVIRDEMLEAFADGRIPSAFYWQTLITGLYDTAAAFDEVDGKLAEVIKYHGYVVEISEEITNNYNQIQIWHGEVDTWQQTVSKNTEITETNKAETERFKSEAQASSLRSGDEADRSKNEADRSKIEADESALQATFSTNDANRSKTEADRSKLEADRAEDAANDIETGVTSFNSRTGTVIPEPGDYSAADVGAFTQMESDNKYEKLDSKNSAYGYPGLDAAGKIDVNQIPFQEPLAIVYYATKEERNADTGRSLGDMAILPVNSEKAEMYILKIDPAGSATNDSDWVIFSSDIEVGVNSFNGRIGDIVPEKGDYTTAIITHENTDLNLYLGSLKDEIPTTAADLDAYNKAEVDAIKDTIPTTAADLDAYNKAEVDAIKDTIPTTAADLNAYNKAEVDAIKDTIPTTAADLNAVDISQISVTPAADKIPVAGSSGKIDQSWITEGYLHADWFDPLGPPPIYPGEPGFGVGVCLNPPTGFSALNGTDTPTSSNFGNYQYSDGSIMCWIPLFYYKIVGNNVTMKGESDYASRSAAEADGFALHRAFIDGGKVHSGFFVDKYQVSAKSGVASSIKDGLPMSSSSFHNPYSQVGADNTYYGSIDACKTRGPDFFASSRFIQSALALQSLAHGQASQNATYCAWYDAGFQTNFPKGCNNNALGDTNDSTVKYISDGYSNCGKTGSGTPFSKTTHNGQESGVADLNGNMFEIGLGISRSGTSATDTTGGTPDDFWVLKESSTMSDLTSGWNGIDDAWGDVSHMSYSHQKISLPHIESYSGTRYFGNADQQVLSGALSGTGWLATGLGFPQNEDAWSSSGTDDFGKDYFYSYRRANLCLLSGGYWATGSNAGVWYANLNNSRHTSSDYVGCRAACYLS